VRSTIPAPDELVKDPLYPRLKKHVVESTGLAYYEDKDTELAQRIGGRLSCLGLPDCTPYFNLLCDPLRGPVELDALIAEITIGETYLFRHREHFDALRDVIIPQLIERNRESRSLRIWCAGCADGSEPYSLAILLQREMADRLRGWQVTILGTDINRRCLARAREGRFEEWALRATPEDVRRDCFRREGKGWSILPEYRESVSFQYHNLVEHAFPSLVNNLSTFDLIVCRNVMIYFGPDRMRKMVLQFHDCLTPGGWFLVGPSEPNMTYFTSFRTVNAPWVTLYQKPDQPVPVPARYDSRKANGFVTAGHPSVPGLPDTLPEMLPSANPQRKDANPPLAHGLGDVRRHADRGEWTSAARCCETLLKKNNRNSAVHFYYGLVLGQIQRGAEAERSLRRAIELDRQSVLPHYYLGLSLQARGDLRHAAQSFEHALELLEVRDDADIFADADGITVAELKNLVRMHIETLRERA
jgi:chemotaxis protein methyltransferase CheR